MTLFPILCFYYGSAIPFLFYWQHKTTPVFFLCLFVCWQWKTTPIFLLSSCFCIYHLIFFFCVAIVAEFDCLMISFDYAIWNMVTNEKQYFVFYDYTIIVNPNKELKLLVDSFNFLFVFMVLNVIGYWFFYT